MVRDNGNGKLRIELWESVYEFLSIQGVKVNRSFFKNEITSHPDYPALTSVTDFLESVGMSYKSVQTDLSYIGFLNYPILAHIRQTGNEFIYLIKGVEEWEPTYALLLLNPFCKRQKQLKMVKNYINIANG